MAKPRLVAAEGKSPPARSAEREALSAAIEQHAEAGRRLVQIREAAERAAAIWSKAARAEEAAADALAEAKENEGRLLAEQLIAGDRELKASPVERAEQALAKAESHLHRTAAARDLVRQQVPVAEQEVKWTANKRDEAARAVIRENGREHISRLLQEAQAMQAELVERRIALRYLWHCNLAPEPEAKAIECLLQDSDLVTPGGSAELEHDRHPASLPWRNVVAALATDAGALLPD
jgi:hypothetical protein